ncbi:MAG: hypothetical protein A3K41_02520 [Chloroflexi bacterium RIFOXYD12_FULL_57_15]|nr:MAG: hypothetical protein A3K41_02520 [Chloroflexi bacterium RIFOXYD12_FULL_57_15]
MLQQAVKSSQTISTVVDISTESTYVPNFPYIEMAKFTGGESAVIRGTRVSVWVLIGYLELGETPKTIVEEVLPFLKLDQVLDAQRYYEYHKDEIDEERRENTEEAGRKYLRERLSKEDYRKITGG